MTNPEPRFRIVQEVMGDGRVFWFAEACDLDEWATPGAWQRLKEYGPYGSYTGKFNSYDRARDRVEAAYRAWQGTQVVATASQEIAPGWMPDHQPAPFERRQQRDPAVFGAQCR